MTDERVRELIDALNEAIEFGDDTKIDKDLLRDEVIALTELLHLREKQIQDNLDVAHYLSEIGALKGQVDILRGLVKRLVEDGERMAQILSDGEGKEDEICCVDYFYARDAIYNHAALMKDIEEAENG